MRKFTPHMKNSLKGIVGSGLMLVMALALSGSTAFAQCDDQEFVDHCAVNLGDEYAYLRTFDAEEEEGSTDYPYKGAFLFRKGVNYIFTSCGVSEDYHRIVVNLYNRTRKKVASTYNEESGKHYDRMVFKCNATGIFFVQVLTTVNESSCGITMLGFSAQ